MRELRRTMLFMPGNNPGMLQNAAIMGADSIILDLEDAVNLSEKDSARILVREAIKSLDFDDVELVIRINSMDNELGVLDVMELGRLRPDAILVPKADEESILEVHKILDKIEKEINLANETIKLIPLIETAYGVENVYNIIRCSGRVNGILLGGEDLTADLGIKRTKAGEEIFYARNKVAIACRAFKVSAIDTPFTDIDDLDGLQRDTLKGKSVGMTGKAAINPRQIDIIHSVFAPSVEDIKYSRRVLEAMEQAQRDHKGVFSLDGKMVDTPIINRAKTVINLAKNLGMV